MFDSANEVQLADHGATTVGLGESAHGTHTQLTLHHRVARYLIEELGLRTIGWEEEWGSGVAIDRYVRTGEGDPRAIVGDAMFMLQSEAMPGLVKWMRSFNASRPAADQVRFLGADVLELRPVQFDEIVQYTTDVAPEQLDELHARLVVRGYTLRYGTVSVSARRGVRCALGPDPPSRDRRARAGPGERRRPGAVVADDAPVVHEAHSDAREHRADPHGEGRAGAHVHAQP